MRTFLTLVALAGATVVPAGHGSIETRAAQQHEQADLSPYAGETGREIKALSPEEVAAYLAGEGMGFAMAAELNRFPGPKHVLELRTELELSAEQVAAVERVFDAMQAEARRLGAELVDIERRLDGAFAAGAIDTTQLGDLVQASGRVRATLRYVHLAAHLTTTDLLSEGQVHAYDRLRGYADHTDHSQHHQSP